MPCASHCSLVILRIFTKSRGFEVLNLKKYAKESKDFDPRSIVKLKYCFHGLSLESGADNIFCTNLYRSVLEYCFSLVILQFKKALLSEILLPALLRPAFKKISNLVNNTICNLPLARSLTCERMSLFKS